MKKKLQNVFHLIFTLIFCCITIYSTAYASENVTCSIPIRIELEGTLPEEPEDFTIIIQAVETGNPLPNNVEGDIYKTYITGASTETIPEMYFNKVGIYNYTIYQEAGNNSKCTYDKSVYHLIITITNAEDNDGLTATIALYKDGVDEKQTEIVFRNIYETEIPKTGDSANAQMWIILVALSIAGIGYSTKRKLSK